MVVNKSLKRFHEMLISNKSSQKEKISVIHIIPSLAVLGGLQYVVANIVKNLPSEIRKIYLIIPYSNKKELLCSLNIIKEVLNPNRKRIYLVPIRVLKIFNFYDIAFSFSILTIVRTLEKVNIIHIHTQNSILSLEIALIGRKYKKKIITQILGVNYACNSERVIARTLGCLLQRTLVYMLTRISNYLITVNKRDFKLVKRGNIIILPHGVSKTFLKEPIKPLPEENKLLYLGRITYEKGLHILIASVIRLKRLGYNLKLEIVGRGDIEYINFLKKLTNKYGLKNNVRFTDFVYDENKKIDLIDNSFLIVLPSLARSEAFPLVLLESWSRSRPVVATNVGGLKSIIKENINGIIVSPNNYIELSEAIRKIIMSKKTNKWNNIRKSTKIYSWDEIAKKIAYIYNKLMYE